MIDRSSQRTCIETFPASDGLDYCVYGSPHHGLHRDEFGRTWSTQSVTTVSQDQPQPHDEPVSVTSNVRELVRNHEISNRDNYEATRDFIQSLENIIRDQEAEIKRLSEQSRVWKTEADRFTEKGRFWL